MSNEPDHQAEEGHQGPAASSPAWERRDELGVFRALVATTRALIGDRTRAFREMDADGGMGGPLLYAHSCATLLLSLTFILRCVYASVRYSRGVVAGIPAILTEHIFPHATMVVVLPILNILVVFGLAGMTYLSTELVSRSRPRFVSVLRVICYAEGAWFIPLAIPVCGIQFLFLLLFNGLAPKGTAVLFVFLIYMLFLSGIVLFAWFFGCCYLGFIEVLRLRKFEAGLIVAWMVGVFIVSSFCVSGLFQFITNTAFAVS